MIDAAAADQALPAPNAPPADVEPIDAPAEPARPDAVGIADAIAAERVLPEIEHAIGPLRQAILDHLLDMADAGPQSVAQILATMPPGTTRGNAEAAIHREHKAGRIVRTSPGHYVLAPPKPPAPPEPPPPAAVKMIEVLAGFAWPAADRGALTEDEWFEALDAWYADPSSWDVGKFGPPDGSKVPFDIMRRWRDRIRKRQERQAEAAARAARQREADAKIRDELLTAAHSNYILGPGLTDMAPVRAILETVPLDDLLITIRGKYDRRLRPSSPPLISWRDQTLLTAVAEMLCRRLAKCMVATWSAAGRAPQTPADAPDVLAGAPTAPTWKTPPRPPLRTLRHSPPLRRDRR
jgi:hypothetical protein